MKENEIIKRLKNIMIFDGYKPSGKNNYVHKEYGTITDFGIETGLMKYHSDWSWLMPVVIKIENIKGATVIIKNLSCEILMFGKCISLSVSNSKQESMFRAVSDYCEWFNEQKNLSKNDKRIKSNR